LPPDKIPYFKAAMH